MRSGSCDPSGGEVYCEADYEPDECGDEPNQCRCSLDACFEHIVLPNNTTFDVQINMFVILI